MRRLGLLLILLAAVGCGGSSDGGPSGGGGGGGGTTQTHIPSSHVIASQQAEVIPPNTQVAIGPFSVPTGATVDYSIVDTPTGIGSDTMDVGIVVDSTASTSSPVAYGVRENVSSTSSTTQPLPAGSYDLVVQCMNLIDQCSFQAGIIATY